MRGLTSTTKQGTKPMTDPKAAVTMFCAGVAWTLSLHDRPGYLLADTPQGIGVVFPIGSDPVANLGAAIDHYRPSLILNGIALAD